ncbi:MAG TPA: amino acid ABC transporter permease [Marmoricola sp.]|nr:amino acid ABC transporter permease [Marmoricola sp.]
MTLGTEAPSTGERPGRIDAVPVRHPGRWVAVAVVAVVAALLVNLVVTNSAFDWSFVLQAMVQSPVLHGLVMGTILGTVFSMIFGVVLGVVLAVMRLSDNPVLKGAAFVYTWFFRAVPRLVLLTIMGTLGILWPHGLGLGIPETFASWFGASNAQWSFATIDANQLFSGLFGGVVGLGLTEAAYMAEIARAGILSVDTGQSEAASALGMSRGKTMRRIILPQAMRVIVPPTGNETIAMVKDTSLLVGVPVGAEMFFQLQAIGSRTFQTFPAEIAAVVWYLIIGTVLMLVQAQLERRFGKGFGAQAPGGPGAMSRMLGFLPGRGQA